jgi:hypothetical protein
VRRFRWMLGLFLLVAAVGCCALPGVDLPETAFDEADLAVSPALPAQPRIQDLPPVTVPIAVLPTLRLYCADCLANRIALEPAVLPSQRYSHSLQILLCTFLI